MILQSQNTNVPVLDLLDSSLNIETKLYNSDIKIIKCGKYFQLYFYKNRVVTDKNLEFAPEAKNKIDIDFLFKEKNINKKNDKQIIEYKNIMRSKFQLQRLVKSNIDIFKTFITLTFEENETNINNANKIFHSFCVNISKNFFKNFVYVCVPEFQKRGAIHYHLLTNIPYDNILFSAEEKKIFNRKSGWQIFKTINKWKKGFSSVKPLDNVNVVGYISKYMTKDIDNRLFGRNRYLASRKGLIYPQQININLENTKHYKYLYDIINNSFIEYTHTYKNVFNEDIVFIEYSNEEIEYIFDENNNLIPKT